MKILRGASAQEITPHLVGRHYEFPCGCRFEAMVDQPMVNGHYPIVLTRDVPLDCPLVYELLGAGATVGAFQLESRIGKTYSVKFQPETLDHISIIEASIRPGCLQVRDAAGVSMTDNLCYRKNGLSEITYSIPAVEPFLRSTYGVMIYQEDLLIIARELAGFDLVKLDKLRKGIGKKLVDVLADLQKDFVDGCEKVGIITTTEAVKLFDDMKKSGRYLFNKSHSIAYAYGTYESAYFKAHFPAYFFTSYLDGARHKMKPLKEVKHIIRDARRFGFEVLTPKFADLQPKFSTDNIRIRFGLTNLKGVGDKAVAKISETLSTETILEWDWFDFLRFGTAACGSTVVRNFIKGGVMDSWGVARQRMLAEFDAWQGLSTKEQEQLCGLGDRITKIVPVYGSVEVQVEEPTYDKTELKAYKALRAAALEQGGPVPDHPQPTGTKFKTKKVKQKIAEDEVVVDEARPCNSLIDGLRGILERPGAVMKNRRPKVESLLKLLENPPYSLEDTPHLAAKFEEELYGVPITTHAMDHVDRSVLDTTIRQFLDGKRSYRMVIGVEVQDVFERTVKNGDNRGAVMATLTVSDGKDFMDDVVVFPEAWELNHLKLKRPGATVALVGQRSNRNPNGFIVEAVWEL